MNIAGSRVTDGSLKRKNWHNTVSDMNKKQTGVWCLAGILLGFGGCHLFLHLRKKHLRPLNVIEYVFFDHTGNPFTLTDREMFEIKHKYEDGVLVSAIAQDYGIDAAMICRIINYLRWL